MIVLRFLFYLVLILTPSGVPLWCKVSAVPAKTDFAFKKIFTIGEVPEINHAFEVARQSNLTKKELEMLEKREIFLHDSKNAILKAQLDGEAKGRREKTIEIARSLVGILDVQTISQTTGLSVAEVEQLRN